MEFCLHYYGTIKSNDGVKGKHAIRKTLHKQLKSLCTSPPFDGPFKNDRNGARQDNESSMYVEINGNRYWFLISEYLKTVVDLSITFLFPYEVGSIVVQGGDIDNRLKTLFDALRIPLSSTELPADDDFDYSDDGMYCLLQDDKLINSIQVNAFKDHDPIDDNSCRTIIKVNTRINAALLGNLCFV